MYPLKLEPTMVFGSWLTSEISTTGHPRSCTMAREWFSPAFILSCQLSAYIDDPENCKVYPDIKEILSISRKRKSLCFEVCSSASFSRLPNMFRTRNELGLPRASAKPWAMVRSSTHGPPPIGRSSLAERGPWRWKNAEKRSRKAVRVGLWLRQRGASVGALDAWSSSQRDGL